MWWIIASAMAQEPAILLPGNYTEIVEVQDTDWLALRCDDQGSCSLTPTTVQVAQSQGQSAVRAEGGALALVQGLPAGPVSTEFASPQALPRYTSVKLGAGTRLVADGGGNYRMMLSFQGSAQPVLTLPSTTGRTPGVRFAGDLDGDSKMDLILDSSGDKGQAGCILLLSSAAAEGELIAQVASFQASVQPPAVIPAGQTVREQVDLGTLGVSPENP